jgi:hypothetical protein
MAGRAPRTDKWTARENKHEERFVLIVGGLVQVADSNQNPHLAEPDTIARGPKTLVLDLTIESGGSGGDDVLAWKPAHFHKDVQANQYADVAIRWDGQPIAAAKILDDSEYDQHLTRITQAANLARPPARGPAKKTSAKRKTAKKTVAKKTIAKKKVGKKKVAKKKVAKKKAVKKRVAKKRSAAPAKRAGASRKKRPSASAKKRRTARR